MALLETNAVISELLAERRRDRWFKCIRSILWLLAFIWIASTFAPSNGEPAAAVKGDYVSVVDINGAISLESSTSSYSAIKKTLERAFNDPFSKGVVVRVNSPGGSPVQSDLIREEIAFLKDQTKKKVIVVGEEMLTSGAYLASLSADVIYAHPSTLVGSIGVRMDSFGAVGLIENIGVERRVFSAGKNKIGLDPFLPVSEPTKEHIADVLGQVHSDFIAVVRASRGEKLANDDSLMTGQFWTGNKSLELGLIDGVGSLRDAVNKEFGVSEYHVVEPSVDLMKRISGLTGEFRQHFDALSSSARLKSEL